MEIKIVMMMIIIQTLMMMIIISHDPQPTFCQASQEIFLLNEDPLLITSEAG